MSSRLSLVRGSDSGNGSVGMLPLELECDVESDDQMRGMLNRVERGQLIAGEVTEALGL